MIQVAVDGVDVIIPSLDNPAWITRCLNALLANTPSPLLRNIYVAGPRMSALIGSFKERCQDQRILYVETNPEQSSWRDHVLAALNVTSRPLVLLLHDDALVMPGDGQWMERLLYPFSADPFVAVSCATVTTCRFVHQRTSTAISPGYYYTNSFMPMAFLARRDVITDAITRVPEDQYMDQELSLNLIEQGWKIVMATNVCLHHEGMQTYGRIYKDRPDWFDEWEKNVKADVPKRHLASWCARMDRIEMIPMRNALSWNGDQVTVLYE